MGDVITFSLDLATIIQMILSVFMPILVGLITTKATSSAVKAWGLAGATLMTSILTGFSEALASSQVFDVGMALLSAIPAFAISVAIHYGLWKPTGVSEKAQSVLITSEDEDNNNEEGVA